ncbi:MAG: hypothetical protein RQ875_12180 [Vicingaceae bacterium]|nr:hypothetical protein [Vicingaceae bacterium]
MNELQLLATYLTDKLNLIIAAINAKTAELLGLQNDVFVNKTDIATLQSDVSNNSTAIIATQSNLNDKLSVSLGGAISGDIDMQPGTEIIFHGSAQLSTAGPNNLLPIMNNVNAIAYLDLDALTVNRVYSYPNKDITVAGLDDIAQAIADLVDSSPAALDTLNELAAALGNDPNFATTVNNAIADKLSLSGGTMTGDIDFTTNDVALQTDKIKTSVGRFDWLAGLDSLIHDFTSWIGGGGSSYTQIWRPKHGTVAHLDDIGVKILGIDVSNPSHTGSLVDTVLVIIPIPAGEIQVGDVLKTEVLYRKNLISGCKPRAYLNTSPDLSGAPVRLWAQNTAARQFNYNRTYYIDSLSSMKSYYAFNFVYKDAPTSDTTATLTSGEYAVDWSIDQYFIVSIELNDITDVGYISGAILERKRQT